MRLLAILSVAAVVGGFALALTGASTIPGILFEVRGKDGTTKQVERGIPIPPIQAFLWRVAGRVPTPLGNLAEARELNLALYRKRRSTANVPE